MEEHKQQQRAHFDSAAETLPERLPLRETVMALHQVNYNRFVRRLTLHDQDHVLEVGFGWVQLIRVLAGDARFQGVGMDLSFSMVAAAHRERGRMHFLVGDAENLPFPSARFDTVFALSLIEHLPHQETGLRELHRILAPGGRLLLQAPVRDDFLSWQFFYRTVFPGRFRDVLERLAHKPELVPPAARLRTWLRKTGFEIEWERRDEVFFQPIYDYYFLNLLDRLKLWKDRRRNGSAGKTTTDSAPPVSAQAEYSGTWRPRPSGIHRYLLPVASALLIPDYLLGICGIGASVWMLARKK